jgi:hypothetical protein
MPKPIRLANLGRVEIREKRTLARSMNTEPQNPMQIAQSLPRPPTTAEDLPAPCNPKSVALDNLSRDGQQRLLSNLKRIRSAIETFGETIGSTVVPALIVAVQTPPSMAESARESIPKTITTINNSVTILYSEIDCFVRQGNAPLMEYRSSVEAGIKAAMKLLSEANQTSDDNKWRGDITTAIMCLRRTTSDDCEVITPNLLVMIAALEQMLAST